jgi:hypothetical protein
MKRPPPTKESLKDIPLDIRAEWLKEAVAEAIAEHKRIGRPIWYGATARSSKFPPEEIVVP